MMAQMDVDFGWMTSEVVMHVRQAAERIAEEWCRPSLAQKPTLSKDGDMWCVLLGDNLQEGISGFGPDPFYALVAFDRAFTRESGTFIIERQP